MTMEDKGEQGRALIEAWTQARTPSAEVRARTWEAVQSRAAVGELGPDLGPESAGDGGVSVVASSSPKLVLLISTMALGVGLVAFFALRDRGPQVDLRAAVADGRQASEDGLEAPESEAVPAPARVELPRTPSPAEPSVAPPTEPNSTDEVGAPKAAAPAPRRTAARVGADAKKGTEAEPAKGADSLAVEMQLLGAARSALKAGDVNEALTKLDAHAQRFPRGALATERELTRVTALCAAGRSDEAETVARRFIATRPQAGYRKRLAGSCVADRLGD